MKIISIVLYAAAIFFLVLGLSGHSEAWAAAASTFLGATIFIVVQHKDKGTSHKP